LKPNITSETRIKARLRTKIRRYAANAPELRDAPQHRQPVRKPTGEQEARHDRVGVAEVGVVVLEHGQRQMNGGQSPEEVDHEHAGDRVAAELVHRIDPPRRPDAHGPFSLGSRPRRDADLLREPARRVDMVF
jgi:hypothetical protein